MTRILFSLHLSLPICLGVAFSLPANEPAKETSLQEENEVIQVAEKDIRHFYDECRQELFVAPPHVRVKAVLTSSLSEAKEARQRAAAGEDFDKLIAEYSVPFVASHGKETTVFKQVDFGWVDQAKFWRGKHSVGPLSRLNVGELSPHPSPAGSPPFAVLKILAKRDGWTAPLEEVRDNIYSHLWDGLADTSMLQEIQLGKNPRCGICRAGRNVNGQLWHVAQHYHDEGLHRKAVSACLLALREHRLEPGLGGPGMNENGFYPEEQCLIDHGVDLVRYYAGVIDRAIRGHQIHLPDNVPLRIGRIKDDRVVPALVRLAANRGRWSDTAALSLGRIKAQSAIPTLQAMLSDRRLSIAQWSRGEEQGVFAEYYLRPSARNALQYMGVDPGKVKIIVGIPHGDRPPKNYW